MAGGIGFPIADIAVEFGHRPLSGGLDSVIAGWPDGRTRRKVGGGIIRHLLPEMKPASITASSAAVALWRPEQRGFPGDGVLRVAPRKALWAHLGFDRT